MIIEYIFDDVNINDNDINNSINILLDNIQKLIRTDILIDNYVHNLTNNILFVSSSSVVCCLLLLLICLLLSSNI